MSEVVFTNINGNVLDDHNVVEEFAGTGQNILHEKNFWSDQEDKKLSELVDKFKDESGQMKHNWTEISKYLPGRTREQCRKRWHYKLDPSMKHGKWSPEEDTMLLKLHKKLGNKWAKIGKIINGRSDVEVKNHFYGLQRKIQSDEEIMKCLNSVQEAEVVTKEIKNDAQSPVVVNTVNQPLNIPIQYIPIQQFSHDTFQNPQFHGYPNYQYVTAQQAHYYINHNSSNDYYSTMNNCRPSGLVVSKAPLIAVSSANTTGNNQTIHSGYIKAEYNDIHLANHEAREMHPMYTINHSPQQHFESVGIKRKSYVDNN